MSRLLLATLAVVFCIAAVYVSGHATGADPLACGNGQVPAGHIDGNPPGNTQSSAGAGGYQLTINGPFLVTSYTPDSWMIMTISAGPEAAAPLKGILVGAYSASAESAQSTRYGRFISLNTADTHPLCNDDSAITHSQPLDRASVSFNYTTPPKGTGSIKFYATVVASGSSPYFQFSALTLTEFGAEVPSSTADAASSSSGDASSSADASTAAPSTAASTAAPSTAASTAAPSTAASTAPSTAAPASSTNTPAGSSSSSSSSTASPAASSSSSSSSSGDAAASSTASSTASPTDSSTSEPVVGGASSSTGSSPQDGAASSVSVSAMSAAVSSFITVVVYRYFN